MTREKIKILVPFKYLVEVEMEDKTGDTFTDIKYRAIEKAIKYFNEDFKEMSVLDIAHTLAPIKLDDILIKLGHGRIAV